MANTPEISFKYSNREKILIDSNSKEVNNFTFTFINRLSRKFYLRIFNVQSFLIYAEFQNEQPYIYEEIIFDFTFLILFFRLDV